MLLYQILAMTIWSSSFVAAKYAYTMLDPALMVQFRLFIAAAIVLPTCRRYLGKIPKTHWKMLLWVSFMNYVVTLMLQFLGVKYTSAASAATVIGLEPIIMVLLGHLFFKDKVKWPIWLCGITAFIGVALLVMGGHASDHDSVVDWFGCLLIALAGITFCFIYRPTQKLINEIGAPAYTSVSLLVAAFMCLPFSLTLAESLSIDWNIQGSLALLYLGIGCSWFAYWLWNKGMKSVPANVSGMLTALEPVFGVLLAVLLLGESISPLSGLGIIMIIAATLTTALLPKHLIMKQHDKNNQAA